MKRSKRTSNTPPKVVDANLEVVHRHAAGIDVGNEATTLR